MAFLFYFSSTSPMIEELRSSLMRSVPQPRHSNRNT